MDLQQTAVEAACAICGGVAVVRHAGCGEESESGQRLHAAVYRGSIAQDGAVLLRADLPGAVSRIPVAAARAATAHMVRNRLHGRVPAAAAVPARPPLQRVLLRAFR